jgi:glycyl-tRNA synthetase
MEVQFYIEPKESEGEKWFNYWKKNRMDWYLSLGMKKENLRFRDHEDDERAHYARMATDIEYNAPWGWSEFMGIHHRGDWDLSRHQEYSRQNLEYFDQTENKRYIPWDIETSAGVDRSLLFLLIDSYTEEDGRVFLKLDPRIAPYKAAIFPLLGNKPELTKKARELYEELRKKFMIAWDDRGNIGKRYASQDEIGTPYCITVDFDSLKDDSVTVRDRDTAKQERITISEIERFLEKKING